ncbi:MAG TPA: hypothetical protein VGC03_07520 [Acidimicrobiia bacterium]
MKFRSHLTRPLDPASPWNRAAVFLSVAAGVIGATLTLGYDRDLMLALQAAGTTILAWALVRELNPDHQMSAIVAAVLAGGWALIGRPTTLLPFAGLLLIARLLVETTGRRPLPIDLGAVAILATVISITPLGWVMGFGLAVAIYVDDRMAEAPKRQTLLAAMAAAVGSSAVVTLTRALPEALPTIRPLLTALIGLLALYAVMREPVEPVSFTDSRDRRFLRRDRLHVGRAVAGILLFIGSFISGAAASVVVPMAMSLAIALVSTELERLQRSYPRPRG